MLGLLFVLNVSNFVRCHPAVKLFCPLHVGVRSSTNTWPSWQRSTLRPNSSHWTWIRPRFWQTGCGSKLFPRCACLLTEKQRTMWWDSPTWETLTSFPQRCWNGDSAVRMWSTTGEIPPSPSMHYSYTIKVMSGWKHTRSALNFIPFSCCSGNLMEPPTGPVRSGTKFTKVDKKTIRGRTYDSDSDSDNWKAPTLILFLSQ